MALHIIRKEDLPDIYKNNERVGSRSWYAIEAPTDELEWYFVTFLSYWVQATVLMLYYDKCVTVCETTAALDSKFSTYALKQREVYFV